VDFSTNTLLLTWRHAGFRIELHQPPNHSDPSDEGIWLGYRLYDDLWACATGADPLVFTGHDLGVAEDITDLPLALNAVNALCGFFSRQPGDISDAYFAPYTREQLAWRDARARYLTPRFTHGVDVKAGPQLQTPSSHVETGVSP
jgi:hypothetical protein